MVETIRRCNAPKESIEKLLFAEILHFPDQPLDWDYLLNYVANSLQIYSFLSSFTERMQFLTMCGMSDHVEALAFKGWRESILNRICAAEFKWAEDDWDSSVILRRILG